MLNQHTYFSEPYLSNISYYPPSNSHSRSQSQSIAARHQKPCYRTRVSLALACIAGVCRRRGKSPASLKHGHRTVAAVPPRGLDESHAER